jgi:peptide/nickel transport system substrate-binding protein
MTTRDRCSRTFSVLGLLLVAVACSPSGGPPASPADGAPPTRGGTVVLGSISDVDSWNEYLSHQSFSHYLLRRIWLRLATESGDGYEHPDQYSPVLAESWERSPDGRSITFRLREASWSDGRPIEAEDVVFTWKAQTSVPWTDAASKERISNVVALDARTVRFDFDGVYPYQLADAVEGGILPRHVYSRVSFEQWVSHDWSTETVGSGPFLLERHDPGHEIVLRRNPHYYDDARGPLLDRVVVRIVPDVVNLLGQLKAGDVDLLLGVPPRDAQRFSSEPEGPIGLLTYAPPSFEYLGWNCARAPFDDAEVRRAMTLAIDRRALVEDLAYDYAEVGVVPVPSRWWGASHELEAWPYDPDEARRILRERGFATLGADGKPEGGGSVLELTMLTNAGNQLRQDTLVKVQEQLARIGVRAHVRSLDGRALREQAAQGDFDVYLGGWTFVGKVPLETLFGSRAVPPEGSNMVRYASPAVDRDLEQLRQAGAWQDMKPLLDAIQRRIHEDQPYTLLYEREGIAAHGPRVHGLRIDVPADPLAGLEQLWLAAG